MQAWGLETANQVALFEVANAQAIAALVAEQHIACDLRAVTTADVFVDAAEAAKITRLWDAMSRLDCPTLRDVTCHGPGDAAERATGVKGAKVAFAYESYLMWPYKFVMHLLAGVVGKGKGKGGEGGVNLQTHTPVHEVSETPDTEGYWTVATSRGAVKARKVLFATNGYTGGLLPEYDDAIYAARGSVARVVSTSSSSSSPPAPAFDSCGLDSKSPATVDSYFGTRADGSLIVGGARSAYIQDRSQWYRNFDDSTLIAPAVPFFEGWARKTLVGWDGESTGTVESVWTGIMGVSYLSTYLHTYIDRELVLMGVRIQYTADDAPHVGLVPAKPGLYICAGFNGHGMPNVLLCAKGLAAMVRDGATFADTGIPACYETGAARLRKIAEGAAARTTGRARADIYLKYQSGC